MRVRIGSTAAAVAFGLAGPIYSAFGGQSTPSSTVADRIVR
jgi:hypothetical protein